MKISRSTALTAAAAAAAALAATGVTYASAASAPEAAPAAPAAVAAPAAPAAAAPMGGAGTGNNDNNGKGNEGREGGRGERGFFEGRVQINERSYSAHPGDCITVVSGLGARTLNIRNDTHRVVEVFRGAVCDNGAPVAVVGPFSQSDGVRVHCTPGVHVRNGVIGSFRVVGGRHGGGHDGGDWGGDGGWDDGGK
jgi:hypothetical protein